MKKIELENPRVQQAIVLYKSGKTVKEIRRELHMDGVVVEKYLTQVGLLPASQELRRRRSKFKGTIYDNVLDILTPEALYWVGFIYADGHLAKDRPRIVLGLAAEDKDHVQKFAEFFGSGIKTVQVLSEGTIRMGYVCQAAWRAQFSSKQIYNRLIELGVTPRKTYDIIPHETLKNSRDFWRGVVDGDGSLSNTQRVNIHLSGHQNTVVEFLAYLNRYGLGLENNPTKSKRSDHLWSANINDNKAKNVINFLYQDATVYLERKYKKYQEIKERVENKIKKQS